MSWSDATAVFRTKLPGYEERKSQADLATALEAAIADQAPALLQAPPGTGKSFPAIICLLDRARELRQPCVVGTATKALQDQYIGDCNFVKENYRPDFRFTVLKGRGNYLCKSKMNKADETLLMLPKSIDELNAIGEDDEVLGDVERLGIDITPVQKRALTSTSDECPGKSRCKFGDVCFAERAKAKSENADVIIVNHALLAIDATLKADGIALLPNYPVVVLDEGHEFRNYVENALSTEFTENGIKRLTSEVASFTNDFGLTADGDAACIRLFGRLSRLFDGPRETTSTITPAVLVDIQEPLMGVFEHLEKLEAKVALVQVFSDDDSDVKKRLRRRCENMLVRYRKVILDDFAETVRWVERDEYRGTLLKTAPMDVAPFLNEIMWSSTTPIFLSATLAIANPRKGLDFSYVEHEMGLDLTGKQVHHFDCPTPFSFETQAVTYIDEDIPSVRRDPANFASEFHFKAGELIKAADGRTLLLFTSWAALRDAYNALSPKITAMGHTVFKQGDMPSRQLADAFAADEHSVLFATKSFFTGVNITGDSLRCLIIQKLPFHYPDPLWRARCDAIDATCDDRSKWTKGSHPTLQVPDMIMTLIQGYGRLIRTMEDRGLVAIFDQAVTLRNGTKYGKERVRPALPPAPIVTNLRDAVEALLKLEAEVS